jgi:hypothetical protein
MGWVMLAIAAVAAAGVVAVLRSGRQTRRRPGMAAYRQQSHTERNERPHRRLAQYHSSGVLPHWDP